MLRHGRGPQFESVYARSGTPAAAGVSAFRARLLTLRRKSSSGSDGADNCADVVRERTVRASVGQQFDGGSGEPAAQGHMVDQVTKGGAAGGRDGKTPQRSSECVGQRYRLSNARYPLVEVASEDQRLVSPLQHPRKVAEECSMVLPGRAVASPGRDMGVAPRDAYSDNTQRPDGGRRGRSDRSAARKIVVLVVGDRRPRLGRPERNLASARRGQRIAPVGAAIDHMSIGQ